jgi:branched-chain amino acid aminotransferase
MPITPTKYIWFNGELTPWEKATVHVMTHALHYGSSVFEGIRCYSTPRGPAVFRLAPHTRRLFDSARIYHMELPYSQTQISDACKSVVRENELQSAYLRPLVWRGYGEIGVFPLKNPVEVMVAAIEWGAYLGAEALENGVDVAVSSWQRVAPNTVPGLAKAGGNYLSSILVTLEARRLGFAEGIALNPSGYVSEGAGENLFVVQDGKLFTPPVAASILSGITRDSVIKLAEAAGLTVREQDIPRELLYIADEVFLTGTAAEITPVRSVDRIAVGEAKRGPVTERLQKLFFGLFDGSTADRWGWLEPIAQQKAARVDRPIAV